MDEYVGDNEINKEERKETKNKQLKTIIFLLCVILFFCIFLSIKLSTITNKIPFGDNPQYKNRVLLVTLEDSISNDNCSDSVQVKNALLNGGTIRVKDDNDGYFNAFGNDYKQYGASDQSGSFWTKGAVLNYIASRGWTLVQAPASGLSESYYFVK